jgi:hypothetical protein
MKNLIIFGLAIVALSLVSCRASRGVNQMPPGQAKKVFGHRNARVFAPGQQRKNTTVIIVRDNDDNNFGRKGKKGKWKSKHNGRGCRR